jgi:mannose-6-phosphate isomerase-like protein (cupin superfamily)
MFYVLEGTLTMDVDGARRELGPGSFACVAPGIAHTFSNPSASPVRFLNFNTPGGFEHYMRDLGDAARSGPLTPEIMGPIASRYDFELA